MSQNTGINPSLYILKNQSSALRELESYLKARKWDVVSFINLKDAVNYIFQRPPQFLLLSLDHPNHKALELPEQLRDSFLIQIVGFSDNPAFSPTRALLETGVHYYLAPPLTGTNLERIIQQAHKDELYRMNELAKNSQVHSEAMNAKKIEEARRSVLSWVNADTKPEKIYVGGDVGARKHEPQPVKPLPSSPAPEDPLRNKPRRYKPNPEDLEEIDIDTLSPEDPVQDDIFLYLPMNKKYILYTPEGFPIEAKQKDRLKRKGVKKMMKRKR
jgi:DNA-binding NarL/FixJ family response regulator